LNTWLSRPDIVPCESLLLVRATLDAGRCHGFHRHPTREEIIYILSGQAEQWCGREYRILKPGEMVLIPKNEIHGTYNPFREPVIFLAMLSPSVADEPGTVNEWDTEAPKRPGIAGVSLSEGFLLRCSHDRDPATQASSNAAEHSGLGTLLPRRRLRAGLALGSAGS